MSVRDRFDPGGKAAITKQSALARHVQIGTQNECANHQINAALEAQDRHVVGTFAQQLLDAYFAESRHAYFAESRR